MDKNHWNSFEFQWFFVLILTENGGASIIKYKLKLKATEYLLPHEF